MRRKQWLIHRVLQVGFLLAVAAIVVGVGVHLNYHVQQAAGRTQCASNLKQIGVAVLSCDEIYKRLPPVDNFFPASDKGWQGTVLFHLLPLMEISFMDQGLWDKNSDRLNSEPPSDAKRGKIGFRRESEA